MPPNSGPVKNTPAKKPAGKVATAKGYKRPEKLPEGFVIDDKTGKRKWCVGDVMGQGGFADVYSVNDGSKPVSVAKAKFVLKLEPKDNGPLFQETHFFKAAGKKDSIAAFMTQHSLKSLGVLEYIGSGVMEYNDKELRWLVIPRLGRSVQEILDQSGGKFSRNCVIAIALQLIDILEYIHTHGYAHADIKAGNMMIGHGKTDTEQVFLIDFGLAKKFMSEGKHIPEAVNSKAAHDGTLELTSIDAHRGLAASRRGDMQILGFNIVKWLVGTLPWSDQLPDFVRAQKVTYFLGDQAEFFRIAFSADNPAPKEVKDYFKAIKSLEYTEKPDYDKLRSIFAQAHKDAKVRKSDLRDLFAGKPPTAAGVAAVAGSLVKKRLRDAKTDDGEDDAPPAPKPRARPAKASKPDNDGAGPSGNGGGAEMDVDLTKLPPAQRKKVKAAMDNDGAGPSGNGDGAEMDVDLAKLPPGQRRKVKAAMEEAAEKKKDPNAATSKTVKAKPVAKASAAVEGDDISSAETAAALAKLPPGRRRKVKAAMEEGGGAHERKGPAEAPTEPAARPTRLAASKSKNYVDLADEEDKAKINGKRTKKDG